MHYCLLLFSVVPHITNAVQEWVEKVALNPLQDNNVADVCIIEVDENYHPCLNHFV
jgi:CTP synthase (UTP-ammonia lyase)